MAPQQFAERTAVVADGLCGVRTGAHHPEHGATGNGPGAEDGEWITMAPLNQGFDRVQIVQSPGGGCRPLRGIHQLSPPRRSSTPCNGMATRSGRFESSYSIS